MNQRFDAQDQRFDAQDQRLGRLAGEVKELRKLTISIGEQVSRSEGQIEISGSRSRPWTCLDAIRCLRIARKTVIPRFGRQL